MEEHEHSPGCDCELPDRAVTDPNFPVTYDEQMSEYQLRLGYGDEHTGIAILRYCPWCGGGLGSKRGTFFTVPREDEIADAVKRMSGIKTTTEMFSSLGEPTESIERAWVQYTYSETWESLELVIHQSEDGQLSHSFCGKYKGDTRQPE